MTVTASQIEAHYCKNPDQDIQAVADRLIAAPVQSIADAISIMRMSRLYFKASYKLKKSNRKACKNYYKIGVAFSYRAEIALLEITQIEIEAKGAKNAGSIN